MRENMLGKIVVNLVTVPEVYLGILADTLEKLTGSQGGEWARELKKFLRKEPCWVQDNSKVIPITRNRFNPTKFIGQGWNIEEEDERSKVLTELDITKVQYVTMLQDGEAHINGEEKLRRLKASSYIRLDADIFLTLWENQHLIPESWKEKVNGNIRCIFFDGTVLRYPHGGRYVLYLYWRDGRWNWLVYWLENDWNVGDPSAVLAS